MCLRLCVCVCAKWPCWGYTCGCEGFYKVFIYNFDNVIIDNFAILYVNEQIREQWHNDLLWEILQNVWIVNFAIHWGVHRKNGLMKLFI